MVPPLPRHIVSRQMFEVQEALENEKAQYAQREATFKKREQVHKYTRVHHCFPDHDFSTLRWPAGARGQRSGPPGAASELQQIFARKGRAAPSPREES